jgi:hypothetical protein
MDDVNVMEKSGAKSRTRDRIDGRLSASRTDGAAHAAVVDVATSHEAAL